MEVIGACSGPNAPGRASSFARARPEPASPRPDYRPAGFPLLSLKRQAAMIHSGLLRTN